MARVRRREFLMAAGSGLLVAMGNGIAPAQGEEPRPARRNGGTEDELGSRYYVYDDKHTDFIPSGWMPDGRGLAQNVTCADRPHSGRHCVRTQCRLGDLSGHWAGIAWLAEGQWSPSRRLNLFGKLKAQQGDPIVLRFWARSKQGAWIEFSVGGGKGDSLRNKLHPGVGPTKVEEFPGVFRVLLPHPPGITLTADWKRYDVDLTGEDISAVVQVFASVATVASVPLPLSASEREERELLSRTTVEWDMDDIYVVKVRQRPKPTEPELVPAWLKRRFELPERHNAPSAPPPAPPPPIVPSGTRLHLE